MYCYSENPLTNKNKRSLTSKVISSRGFLFASILIALGSSLTEVTWTQYCLSGHAATVAFGETYVVYGVNHEATGLTIYSSITAYQFETLIGLTSISSATQYKDSARVYLGQDHPAGKYLFAYRFSRDCSISLFPGGENFCFNISPEAIRNHEHLFFIERMYVNKKTLTGPDYNEVIPARVLNFRNSK